MPGVVGTVSPTTTTTIIIVGQEMHGQPESEANSPIQQQELHPNRTISTYRDFEGDHYEGQETSVTPAGHTTCTV